MNDIPGEHRKMRRVFQTLGDGFALGLLLFGVESSLTHLFTVMGYGWGGRIGIADWVAFAFAYGVFGLCASLVPAILAGHRPSVMGRPRTRSLTLLLLASMYAGFVLGVPLASHLAGGVRWGGAAVFVGMIGIAGWIQGWALSAEASPRTRWWSAMAMDFLAWALIVVSILASLLNRLVLEGSFLLAANLRVSAMVTGVGLLVLFGGLRFARSPRLAPLRGRWKEVLLGIGVSAYALLALIAANGPPEWATWLIPSERNLRSEWGEGGTHAGRPDIILVVMDTLRADVIGAFGGRGGLTPHIDALAERSWVYTNHHTVSPWTYPAFASLLSGRYPSVHGGGFARAGGSGKEQGERALGFQLMDPALPTLATYLKAAGYDTAFIGSNVYLMPQMGLSRGFDHYDVRMKSTTAYSVLADALIPLGFRPFEASDPTMNAAAMSDAFIRWLDEHEERPVFLVAHYMDAHWPYRPPPPYRTGAGPLPSRFEPPLSRLRSLYEGEVRYLDAEFGRFLEAMRRSGRLDHAIVILTADHGEAFAEHGDWIEKEARPRRFDPDASRSIGHGHTLYEELLHVPLIISAPGREPRIISTPTSVVDIVPTLLDYAGIVPEGMGPGRILHHPLETVPIYGEGILYGEDKRCVLSGPYKLIEKPTYPPDARFELYDLTKDPAERENLAEQMRLIRDRLAADLDRHARAFGRSEHADPGAKMDASTIEALRALGYVE